MIKNQTIVVQCLADQENNLIFKQVGPDIYYCDTFRTGGLLFFQRTTKILNPRHTRKLIPHQVTVNGYQGD